jgi:hypothetical protein
MLSRHARSATVTASNESLVDDFRRASEVHRGHSNYGTPHERRGPAEKWAEMASADNELVSPAQIVRRHRPGSFILGSCWGLGAAIRLRRSGRNLPRRCLFGAETDFRILSIFGTELLVLATAVAAVAVGSIYVIDKNRVRGLVAVARWNGTCIARCRGVHSLLANARQNPIEFSTSQKWANLWKFSKCLFFKY